MSGVAVNGRQPRLPDRLVDLTTVPLPAQRPADPALGQAAADEALQTALTLLRQQAACFSAVVDTVARLEERLLESLRPGEQAQLQASTDGDALIYQVRVLAGWLPTDAVVAVVSRGDDRLLQLGGRRAWHFPRGEDGEWAGHHPASSGVAVAQLESQRALGATHLLVPEVSLWWLEHYEDFARHLARRYPRVFDRPDVGVVFGLTPRANEVGAPASLGALVEDLLDRGHGEPAVLNWTGTELADEPGAAVLFTPPGAAEQLPYLDRTIDVVVVADPERLPEAQRVARCAVVQVGERESVLGYERHDQSADPLPSTSVIVPTYNAAGHLRTCLRALAETLPAALDVEVVVVDDGGVDHTPRVVDEAREADPRVRLLRSKRNGGFIDACHRGADEAAGDVLLFLNNDTVPLPGWLEPVLRALRDGADVGAVGGKLLFPDGTLQEAGGVLYADGSGANFGKWDPAPDDPLYVVGREVDYCSGAHLATPTWLWRELGGFDRRYTPAYYEDADYCLSVWDAGLRVLYEPDSVVVHLEGATAGRDPSSGMKRYQAINRETFAEKWKQVLETRLAAPQSYDRETWHRVAERVPSRSRDAVGWS